jgi:hypothetical protein
MLLDKAYIRPQYPIVNPRLGEAMKKAKVRTHVTLDPEDDRQAKRLAVKLEFDSVSAYYRSRLRAAIRADRAKLAEDINA